MRRRSGHVLHSFFWQNLSPDGGDRPDGALPDAIDEHLGGFEQFRKQLTVATTSVQGSGWGVPAWEPLGRRLIVEQVYDHHGNVGQGTTPLLVVDAWEHAYHLQYHLLASLPAARREAFILTQLLGLPYAEAAEVSDCPIGTVRSRARATLMDLLDEE